MALFLTRTLAAAAVSAEEPRLELDESRYKVEVPDFVLTGVPVDRVRIVRREADGSLDRDFNGRPLIRGMTLTVDGRDVALPRFENGVLELTTRRAEGRRVYITASRIVVDPDSRGRTVKTVYRTQRWFSLLPPVLAILLAVWLRNIIIALFAAVFSGAVVLAHGNFFMGFVRTLDTHLLQVITQPDQSGSAHLLIILFTLFLGATVGVMSASGGTVALVNSLARFTKRREHGQVMTWLLGMIVFFDDYANTLLLGTTMRPVTDRLRISREKLAFLVDSTAAPIAGLAVISTWVGVEVGYISDAYARLGMSDEVYGTFLRTIPFRFYPLHLLVFVLLIAYSGRDFGSMLKAESRALTRGELHRPDAEVPGIEDEERLAGRARRQLLRNALIPLVTLILLIVLGLWWTGSSGLAEANRQLQAQGEEAIPTSFWSMLDKSSPNRVLFFSSFLASLVAVASASVSGSLTLNESLDGWLEGARGMFLAAVILVLAWGVARICDADHLNTAGFLVELTHGNLSVSWLPALTFLLAAVTSFATGSSWATMGLLIPLSISMTYYLLADAGDVDPNHPLLLSTIGAVLAGSIFGDHCSPISDTTVLSSAASGCDHLDHVLTQIPYAVSVGLVALLLGYLPVGFGYSPIVLLPLGVAVMFVLVQFVGQPAEEIADRVPAERPAETGKTAEQTGDDAAEGEQATDSAE